MLKAAPGSMVIMAVIVTLLIPGAIPVEKTDVVQITRNEPRVNITTSISGKVYVDQITGTKIIGEPTSPRDYNFGYAGMWADINHYDSDDHLDIRIVADIDNPNTKRRDYMQYTLFGNGSRLPEEIYLPEYSEFQFIDYTTHNARSISTAYGDINGDNETDKVTGFPTSDGPNGLFLAGYILIEFGDTNKTVMISGSDEYDGFGKHVALCDINGDGKDDIIAGAPWADGLGNKETDAGEIAVFFGRLENGFGSNWDAENHADIVLIGVQETDGRIKGDNLGSIFEILDINGDGSEEIAIAFPTRSFYNEYDQYQQYAGQVHLWEVKDLLTKKGVRKIPMPGKVVQIQGMEMEDKCGYYLSSGDLDMDGFDDLLVTSPSADGPENSMPKSGEVNIIYGNGITIGEVKVSGEAVLDNSILVGSGAVNVEFSFRHSPGRYNYTGASLSMGSDVSIDITSQELTVTDDPYHSIDYISGSLISRVEERSGTVSFSLDMNWFFPEKGSLDLILTLYSEGGEIVTRNYPGIAEVVKDVRIAADPAVEFNGRSRHLSGGFASVGDTISFRSIRASYVGFDRYVPDDILDIALIKNGEQVDITSLNTDFVLEDVVKDIGETGYMLALELPSIAVPGDFPGKLLPDLGDSYSIRIPVDSENPLSPEDLRLDRGNDDLLQITWEAQIGIRGDPNGSGVKQFIMMDGVSIINPRESGGLVGTYYRDSDLGTVAMERIDDRMFFDFGDFGPDPNTIPPMGYSIRWHGWIRQIYQNPLILHAGGSGELRIFIDNVEVLGWSDISRAKISDPIDIGEGNIAELLILYRNDRRDGKLEVHYEDPLGTLTMLEGESILHPVNHTSIPLDSDENEILIASQDWTGRISSFIGENYFVDRYSPEFDMKLIPEWVRSGRIILEIPVKDPGYNGRIGSGLDMESISYRLHEIGMPYPDWTRKNMTIQPVSVVDNIVTSATVEVVFDLPLYYNGTLELQGSDLFGNFVRTEEQIITVDDIPLILEMVQPTESKLTGNDYINIIVNATDPYGSGPDSGSLQWRKSRVGGEWSGWSGLDAEIEGYIASAEFEATLGYGEFLMEFRGSDLLGNYGRSPIYRLELKEPVENLPPVPVISKPVNQTTFKIGELIRFNAMGTLDDGIGEFDKVLLSWFSNISGHLGTGDIISKRLPPGVHKITLYADDGSPGHNISTWVEIRVIELVTPDPEGGDSQDEYRKKGESITLIVIVAAVICLTIAVMTFLLVKSQKTPHGEVRLDHQEETPDDRDYIKKMKEEEL